MYNTIRSSIDNKQSAEFAFCLAMVSQNVLDNDEFNLPQSNHKFNEPELKNALGVVSSTLMGGAQPDVSIKQNQQVHDGFLKDVQLESLLTSEAIYCAANSRFGDIESDIYNNLDVNVRSRISNSVDGAAENTVIQDSCDKKPLASVHSIGRPNSLDIELWLNSIKAARALDLVS